MLLNIGIRGGDRPLTVAKLGLGEGVNKEVTKSK